MEPLRMEQYLTHTDYALWEVIVNGDAPAITSASAEGPIPPKIAEQKLARKNELKAKATSSEIKSQSSSSLNSHNVAFISSENTSSTNEAVNTAHEVSTASSQEQASFSTYLRCPVSFLSINLISTVNNEDLEQIDTDDLEDMDLKWQVAMFTMRVKRFLKKTGRNLNFNGKETVGFDKTKVECYNCHRKDGIYGYDWSYQAKEGPTDFALMAHLSSGYQLDIESLEARIVVHQKNEAVYDEDIAFLKYDVKVRDNSIIELKNQLAEALKEKDDLKLKLEKFETSSMKLTKLINSQISVNNKSGVGFDIPHPYTGNYIPSRLDLSFAGLDDSVYKTNVSETITSVPRNETTASKSSKDSFEQPKDVRPSAPIIEEWDSDNKNTRKSVIEQNTYKQAKNLRKSQSPRVDKRNWNGLMTQKLGDDFEFNKKAYIVYGSLNHLIKDCNFYENKMVGKFVLNNMGRVTGQREVRPVWNNAQKVNHQNKLTHPHPKRNFVPTAVATKSGLVPVNAAMQSSSRAAASISTARHVNTTTLKQKVNTASPIKYSYFKAHSPLRRPFNQKSAAKTYNFSKKVYTVKVNNVTTVGPEVVVTTAEGKRENVGNPQYALQDQGIFNSRCSRHMTGNKSYLTDYQDIDGGFVAFTGSPKEGKITGKGKIRSEKLDFEDVYFVKELKFNIFSVSQMCDKKNNVLFTETECLVLSPDFKLLDESHVLLKVLRQNNMYSFDLKNIVPS
ncbi:hypothetical protein Tco_1012170 [Tanacetum coccineum]